MLSSRVLSRHPSVGGPRAVMILQRLKSTISKAGPVKWWERIRDFPRNVKQLYKDCLRMKDIYDASHTPNNAWTNRYGVMGRIPRRQQEQERQLMSDVRIVVPLIILWIPPIIGYLPLFAAMICPRQTLSRQFLNDFERESFAILEMKQRQKFYSALSNHTWASLSLLNPHVTLQLVEWGEDAAGPLWDLEPLLDAFLRTNLVYAESLPTEHLVSLALANGYAQRFPLPIPNILAACTPNVWMVKEIKELGFRIWRDDKLCLEEKYHLDCCNGMTDDEIREACLLRGLPVHVTYDEMRDCVTNHLLMVERLWQRRGGDVPKQHLQIFVLHLPAVRKHFKSKVQG